MTSGHLRTAGAALIVAAALPLGAYSPSASATGQPATGQPATGQPAKRAPTAHRGVANVAYAGSLELLNEKTIGPAFEKATGYSYQGRAGGSFGLAADIASGEISPNVFETVGAAPIERLIPKHTRWYVEFASSPIVVAYNPSSRFAPELNALRLHREPLADLFSLMAEPGFLLGRTNPGTDPQGQAFCEMVELAQSDLHLPAGTASKILGRLDNASEVFAETALEARLEAGQLDAASAFLSQAVQLHLPYVALPTQLNFGSPALAAHYATAKLRLSDGSTVHGVPLTLDITTLGNSGSSAAGSFVAYVLSAAGRRELETGGYSLLRPVAYGQRTAIPPEVRREIPGA